MTRLGLCIVLVTLITAAVLAGSAAKTNFSGGGLVVLTAMTWGLVCWDVMLCGQVESY
jgi:hypothetical protein